MIRPPLVERSCRAVLRTRSRTSRPAGSHIHRLGRALPAAPRTRCRTWRRVGSPCRSSSRSRRRWPPDAVPSSGQVVDEHTRPPVLVPAATRRRSGPSAGRPRLHCAACLRCRRASSRSSRPRSSRAGACWRTTRGDRVSMTLLDWRRRVAELYAEVRGSAERDPVGTLGRFRVGRDRLFRDHAESPLAPEARAGFRGLSYWPYDPAMRFEADVEPLPAEPVTATSLSGDAFPLERIGRVRLPVGALEVYWMARLWRWHPGPVPRCHVRDRDVRGRSLPARHDQGRGSRRIWRPARAGLQLRVPPVVRLRPEVELPPRAAGEPPWRAGEGRRAPVA